MRSVVMLAASTRPRCRRGRRSRPRRARVPACPTGEPARAGGGPRAPEGGHGRRARRVGPVRADGYGVRRSLHSTSPSGHEQPSRRRRPGPPVPAPRLRTGSVGCMGQKDQIGVGGRAGASCALAIVPTPTHTPAVSQWSRPRPGDRGRGGPWPSSAAVLVGAIVLAIGPALVSERSRPATLLRTE